MSLSAISANVAVLQTEAAAVSKTQAQVQTAQTAQTTSPNQAPDTVTISAAGRQAATDGDRDGDSH